MKKDKAYYYFQKIISISDDGFIAVDRNGHIIEINEIYYKFLGAKSKKDVIGKHIQKIIPNTKMLDVMEKRYCEEIGIHNYAGKKTKEQIVLVSRSYVENDMGEVIGGVAQVKFRLQSLDVAKRLAAEYDELNFYKNEYQNINRNKYRFQNLIGSSYKFLEKKQQGMKVCKTNFSVLLTGETGTGKEVFAKAIHNSSGRAQKPIVTINCGAIPKELFESELFGYEDGAFTGAKKGGKKGKFFVANGGTLFLDEIGDLPLNMQSKLLRVLQEKEIEPIGSDQSIPIDVRIITATRKNIQRMISDGSFREDLFYRLNVVNIEMLPLRERKEDILELSKYFLEKLNKEYGTRKTLSKEIKEIFLNYSWPGNIRELDNVIKFSYATSEESIIEHCDLASKTINKLHIKKLDFKNIKNLRENVEEYEKNVIYEILKRNKFSCIAAAKEMGIHKSLLYKKIKKYHIEIKNKSFN